MAAEAEAAREARAKVSHPGLTGESAKIERWIYIYHFLSNKVIAAEGEMNASRALKEAAEVIAESPQALQLRYLQTLSAISAEKNSTIIFPLPISMLNALKSATS